MVWARVLGDQGAPVDSERIWQSFLPILVRPPARDPSLKTPVT